jgi:hypothetical protein
MWGLSQAAFAEVAALFYLGCCLAGELKDMLVAQNPLTSSFSLTVGQRIYQEGFPISIQIMHVTLLGVHENVLISLKMRRKK